MNVLLIGCGRTGRAIAENLIELKYIKTLFLHSRTSKSSKSLSYDLDSKKVKVVSEIKNLISLDYIIIALSGMSESARKKSFSQRNTTYEIRQDELKFNIGAMASLIEDLETFPPKTQIIVVTNPVDEITNYLRIMLHNKNVLGFGLELDVARYKRLLGRDIYCIGTHGKGIPLINLKNEEEYNNYIKKIDKRVIEFLRTKGMTSNITGKYFQEFFKKLNSSKKEIIHVSSYLKKDFIGTKDISISLPYQVKQGKIIGIAKINVSRIEKKRFMESADELKKSVNHIIETHKRLIGYK